MKDIHTHILYGVDDGSNSLEESLDILKLAVKNGVTDIVLTPHYINNTKYTVDNLEKEKIFNELKNKVNQNKIEINLYLGNEIYIDDIDIFVDAKITTINNSKYILVELPLREQYPFLDEFLYNLQKKKLIPIIAHPERYLKYYNNYDFFIKLIKNGCLLQGNIGSLYGKYGRKSKKMLKGLLRRDLIHFMSSDIHSKNNVIYEKNITRELLKIVKSPKKVENLLKNNPEKVLNNDDITS